MSQTDRQTDGQFTVEQPRSVEHRAVNIKLIMLMHRRPDRVRTERWGRRSHRVNAQ